MLSTNQLAEIFVFILLHMKSSLIVGSGDNFYKLVLFQFFFPGYNLKKTAFVAQLFILFLFFVCLFRSQKRD